MSNDYRKESELKMIVVNYIGKIERLEFIENTTSFESVRQHCKLELKVYKNFVNEISKLWGVIRMDELILEYIEKMNILQDKMEEHREVNEDKILRKIDELAISIKYDLMRAEWLIYKEIVHKLNKLRR